MQLDTHIVLIGFMGAGKSTVGDALAKRIGCRYVDVDREILRTNRWNSVREIFAEGGEDLFRKVEARVARDVLAGEAGVIATGGGLVTNLYASQVLEYMQGVCEVVYLRVSIDTVLRRCGRDKQRPLLQQEEVVRALHADRQEAYERCASHSIDTDVLSVEEVVEAILSKLSVVKGGSGQD